MKISISFVDGEREQVMEMITVVKKIFRISRFHEPKQSKDAFFHIYMNTAQR